MKTVSAAASMQKICLALKRRGRSVGFVPTMGALHAGHLSLIKRSRRENDITCVSIFVNPIQFSPGEDYRRYPRPIRCDTLLCKKEKVDLLFAPRAQELFPEGFRTYVEVTGWSSILCGAARPGHFRGVATVVAKLFNIVQPDRAYFGQKDFQQAVILRRMAEDLNFPLKVSVLPTVREADGLAISSRNAYLSPGERKEARVLYRALNTAAEMARSGEDDPSLIKRRMSQVIRVTRKVRLEYVEIIDPATLLPVKRVKGGCAVVLAARVGRVRLIDNIIIR